MHCILVFWAMSKCKCLIIITEQKYYLDTEKQNNHRHLIHDIYVFGVLMIVTFFKKFEKHCICSSRREYICLKNFSWMPILWDSFFYRSHWEYIFFLGGRNIGTASQETMILFLWLYCFKYAPDLFFRYTHPDEHFS